MKGAIRSKVILSLGGMATVCIICLFFTFGNVTSSHPQEEAYQNSLSLQHQLQEDLKRNVSEVADLKAQIDSLNNKILELESIIAKQSQENQKLRLQVENLNGVLTDVEAQLEGLAKAEQIALLVERLQNPPTELAGVP